MKKILAIFSVFLSFYGLKAQEKECGTPVGTTPYVFSKEKQDSINVIMAINQPYCIRAYVTVFANDDGSSRAATDADIRRQFENMVGFYASHNICFMLLHIKQVNSTDLNSHNSSTEEAELNPYLQNDCLNIFVHNTLVSNSGSLNGTAYAIPNTYLSMVSTAIASTTNLSTLAHETGHCFGLYHTFETAFGAENVTRNSGNGCYDCPNDGDLLCDTPADDDGGVNASTCAYNGGGTDACSVAYAPSTSNIMGYGSRPCRNNLTSGQGARMRSTILGTPSLLDLVADDIVYNPVLSNFTVTYSTGEGHQTARDVLYLSNFANDGYNVTGSAVRHIQAKTVHMKPGTHLYPTTGIVRVKSNTYCN